MLKQAVKDNTPIEQTLREHMPAQVRPHDVHFWADRRSSYSSWGIQPDPRPCGVRSRIAHIGHMKST